MKEFEFNAKSKAVGQKALRPDLPELSPEEEARVQRVMDSDFTGLYMDPGKHDRYLPKAEKQIVPRPKKPGMSG